MGSQVAHIEQALSQIEPFEIELKEFSFFDKGGSKKDPDPLCFVFLKPSMNSMNGLQKIYDVLVKEGMYQFCSAKKHNQGFVAHLTCAQMRKSKCKEFVESLNAGWTPLSFWCQCIHLIARTGDDPF